VAATATGARGVTAAAADVSVGAAHSAAATRRGVQGGARGSSKPKFIGGPSDPLAMTPGAARGRPALTTLALLAALVTGGAGMAVAASPNGPDETIEVVASRAGFRPRVVNVRKGDPVRLLLTSADGEHCFALDALRIEKRIVPGKATVLDLTPERSGTYPFYCCLESGDAADSENGRLVIIE